MSRPRKYFKSGRGNYRSFSYIRTQHLCEVCGIACTSFAQLKQHQKGKKHNLLAWSYQKKKQLRNPSVEVVEDTFPLEHMVVLDETEDDLPIASAALPASCDSSDSEIATTSDNILSSHMVILDETHDDNDHPASPASCDSSASDSAPSNSASNGTAKKKIKTEKLDDDRTAQVSRLSVKSSSPFSKPVPKAEAVPGTSRKFSRQVLIFNLIKCSVFSI
ncbi:uncharacterized protein [Dendrobates tinctorius]|uniref:uncharacterized protein n=1 Tax=Dendrobates tinctorius TaxID=92724 RepID=UPI003CC977D1